jgi:transposase
MLAKALLGARSQLLSMSLALENQIRGILKTGSCPRALEDYSKRTFALSIATDPEIAAVIMPLLEARQVARGKCAALDHRPIKSVQGDATCRMLMTMPGVGPITAVPMSHAVVLLTRVRRQSALRRWGLMLWKRLGLKRAATALARKMAVVFHAMWKSGTAFNPTLSAVSP